MKKPQKFSSYIFIVLIVLESLTLAVVVGVLHALLVGSIDREFENRTSAQLAEFRLLLRDRHEHAQLRLDELSTNNGIKVALLLGMSEKAAEEVTSLYPSANGLSFYIRNLSGAVLPEPQKHRFLRDWDPGGRAGFKDKKSHGHETATVFMQPIVRKETRVGTAIAVYDFADDQKLYHLLKAYKNNRLLSDTPEGLIDVSDGYRVTVSQAEKKMLRSSGGHLQAADLLIMPIQGYPSLHLAADTRPLDHQKKRLLTSILLLCLPLLGLTLVTSFMILKKVSLPLNTLAEDARHITEEDTAAHYLNEDKIKHVEFLKLTKAFNKALSHIQQRKAQLQQLNQNLQDEIFERKQLGDALAKSEEQLRSLQDNIPIGLFRSTPQGSVRHANPACLEIFGYGCLEDLRSIDANVLYEHKSDRDRIIQHLEATGTIDGWKVRMQRKDGTLFWALLHIKNVTDNHHRQVFLDGTVQDISQQIEAEKQKKELENQLRQSQKMETIGTLAGGIAHDFNNLLASIMGFSELALEDSQPDSIQQENLKCTLVAAQRAADLVGQILTFARQTDTEKAPIELKHVIMEAIKLMRSTLPSTIQIKEEITSRSAVLAAPTQMHQVIVNLCSNASHAMQESGGVLTIGLTDVEQSVTHIDPGMPVKARPLLKLTVADTGHGIAPEIKDRLFDPYFTTKKPGEGTGIGLSVVQGLVRSHGGFITFDSEPEQGATFNVFLPIIDGEDIPQAVSSNSVVGGSEHILLVDDEVLVIQMGQQMLERLGYKVTTSSNSLEAAELFEKDPGRFDLVITDMTMPELTGDRLAKMITTIRPDIPVILYTGYSNRLDRETIADAGIRAILYKPLVKNDLADTIRNVLSENETASSLSFSGSGSLNG
jgi:PAS domain S-box-containing protein